MSNSHLFQITEEELGSLKSQWQNLARHYPTDDGRIDSTFNLLVEHYSETHRAYHNLSHMKSLLGLSESFADKIQDRNAVGFAIWFHDCIYDTHKNDNEARSADLAGEALAQLSVPAETISLVRDMIFATKHHQANERSTDLQLFLDLDLSVLGFGEKIYQAYSRAIRKEYSWVTEEMYKPARKKILVNFLERPQIYFTKALADMFESSARRNIKNEIHQLASEPQ